ncbi:MAG: hypothetical protein PHP06_06490 [Clostridia bacterium]|nr:hypothetical protein [Clostridia bacterium]
MISCTEFIPAYSELFKYLEKKGGQEAVMGFWEYLSENFLGNLKDLVVENGIRGCWMYWTHTLNEEAADFTLELDEEKGEFKLIMHQCPSKGRLLNFEHIQPYHNYCKHCDILYRRVLEPLGYEYIYDMSEVDKAKCSLTIRKK